DGLHVILDVAYDATLPDQARAAIRSLRARLDLQNVSAAEAVFVTAARSVYFAHRAATLPVADVQLLQQRGRCPVCGFLPVAGVVMASGQPAGLRYLHCGFCATAWNHVRAVCVTCGESRRLALLGIDVDKGMVQAETCDECHTYTKMLFQAKDM